MTRVGRRFHGLEPSERSRPGPHGGRRLGTPRLAVAALVVALAAACGGGPDASVGVVRIDDGVEVRAKACGEGGAVRVDVVDPQAPAEPVWSAVAVDPDAARPAIPVAADVPGYEVDDRRSGGDLPDRRLRVLVEGPDGETWGGPRFRPSELEDGVLRVAGADVPLAEWEDEPARCPEVGLAAALVGGLATAVVAALLWLVVRTLARAVRRS